MSTMEIVGTTKSATYVRSRSDHPAVTLTEHCPKHEIVHVNDKCPPSNPNRVYSASTGCQSWKPSVYYQTAKVSPSLGPICGMPACLNTTNQLHKCSPFKVPSIFGSQSRSLYTRYSPKEWFCDRDAKLKNSVDIFKISEPQKVNHVRAAQEFALKNKFNQQETGKLLGQRLTDIDFWKHELKHEADELLLEIERLTELARVANVILVETENPLSVAQECLYQREKRTCIDLVHDEPELELLREIDTIKRSQIVLRDMIDRANSQLSQARATQHELEKDLDDKHTAFNVDTQSFLLRNTSRGIAFYNGIERVDDSISVPETWAKFTHDHITQSQATRVTMRNLMNDIDTVFDRLYKDMQQRFATVNNAFSRRVNEVVTARDRITKQLSKTMQEIFDTEQDIELMKKSIKDCERYLKVSQTRIQTRRFRPCVERTRDGAAHGLVSEVHAQYETIEELQCKLREAENLLQRLLQNKAILENDLAVKNNSLFIDRERCLAKRMKFPMTSRFQTRLRQPSVLQSLKACSVPVN